MAYIREVISEVPINITPFQIKDTKIITFPKAKKPCGKNGIFLWLWCIFAEISEGFPKFNRIKRIPSILWTKVSDGSWATAAEAGLTQALPCAQQGLLSNTHRGLWACQRRMDSPRHESRVPVLRSMECSRNASPVWRWPGASAVQKADLHQVPVCVGMGSLWWRASSRSAFQEPCTSWRILRRIAQSGFFFFPFPLIGYELAEFYFELTKAIFELYIEYTRIWFKHLLLLE